MVKIYDHAVYYNGGFYPANTPIEEKAEKEPEKKAVSEDADNRASAKPKSRNKAD